MAKSKAKAPASSAQSSGLEDRVARLERLLGCVIDSRPLDHYPEDIAALRETCSCQCAQKPLKSTRAQSVEASQ